MTTWTTIFGVESPVRGEPSEFVRACAEFESRRVAAQRIVDRFGDVRSRGVANHLEGEVGHVFSQVVDEVADSLHDLPRVSAEAHDVLDAHLTALRELRAEVAEALGRARLAWNALNDLETARPDLQSRVRSLTDQLRNADAEQDTSSIEASLTTAERNLATNGESIDSQRDVLGAIYGGFDSEYVAFQRRELDLEHDTNAALNAIDLGDLKDPSWFQSLVSALGDFALGILESVANLIEAFLTGDWATFFWELRNLLNAALLILGTIALFTGVGAPLFFLSVAAFAVTAGLAVTQTPNPQTGETLGLGDVALSAVGVVFSAGGAFRGMSAMREAGRSRMTLFTGLKNSNGQLNGGIFSTVRNVRNLGALNTGGRQAHAAATALNITRWPKHAAAHAWHPYVLSTRGAYTTARVTWGATGLVGTGQRWADVSLGPLDRVTRAGSHQGIADTSGPFSGGNVAHGPDWRAMFGNEFGGCGTSGTPLFGPPATPARVEQVIGQNVRSPEVHVVPAAP